ncbi:MAG TPA: YhbY family RNA-binding protein [Clostridiales bacterium]|jgi:RNA-binding protein|nr:YhbY family RNA-binding protein [Clostridiales bacterium]
MTSKERAAFRAKANSLEPITQIGKGGIGQALLVQINDALQARELIKLKVLLESSPIKPKEAAAEIAGELGAEVIQVIGGSIILYRENPALREEKEKPKKVKINIISKPRQKRSFEKTNKTPQKTIGIKEKKTKQKSGRVKAQKIGIKK